MTHLFVTDQAKGLAHADYCCVHRTTDGISKKKTKFPGKVTELHSPAY